MQDRLILILIIIGFINMIFTAINITVIEKNTKMMTDKRLKEIEHVEKEIKDLKELLALQAFVSMSEKEQKDFIEIAKKGVNKNDV